MGSAVSAELIPPFDYFRDWDYLTSARLLQVYRDNDYDFGIDAATIQKLISEVKQNPPLNLGEKIVSLLSKGSGLVNALSLITGVAFFSIAQSDSSSVEEKCSIIFNAFDFDDCGEISYDELTILLFSLLRAVVVMTGAPESADPSDAQMEKLSDQVYSIAGKHVDDDEVTKDDFTSWVASKVEPKFNSAEIMSKAGLTDAVSRLPKMKPEPAPKKAEPVVPAKAEEVPVFEAEDSAMGDRSMAPEVSMFEKEEAGAGDQSLPPEPGIKLVDAPAKGPVSFTAHKANNETQIKTHTVPLSSLGPAGKTPEQQEEAAIKIQARVRGVEGREKARKKKQQNDAAIKIQTRIRGVEGREKAKRKRAEVEFRRREELQNRSATKIQAQARGRITRRKMRGPSMPVLPETTSIEEATPLLIGQARFKVKDKLMGGVEVVDLQGKTARGNAPTNMPVKSSEDLHEDRSTRQRLASKEFIDEAVQKSIESIAEKHDQAVKAVKRASVNLVDQAVEESISNIIQNTGTSDEVKEGPAVDFAMEEAAEGDQSMAPLAPPVEDKKVDKAPIKPETSVQEPMKEVVPKQMPHKPGDAVMADFLGMGLRAGKVARVNTDGSYDICFDHGAKEVKVSGKRVQKMQQQHKEGEAVLADFLGMGLRAGKVARVNQDGSYDICFDHGAKEVKVSGKRVQKLQQAAAEDLKESKKTEEQVQNRKKSRKVHYMKDGAETSYISHRVADVSALPAILQLTGIDDVSAGMQSLEDDCEWGRSRITTAVSLKDEDQILEASKAISATLSLLGELHSEELDAEIQATSSSINKVIDALEEIVTSNDMQEATDSINGAVDSLEEINEARQMEDATKCINGTIETLEESKCAEQPPNKATVTLPQDEEILLTVSKMYIKEQMISILHENSTCGSNKSKEQNPMQEMDIAKMYLQQQATAAVASS